MVATQKKFSTLIEIGGALKSSVATGGASKQITRIGDSIRSAKKRQRELNAEIKQGMKEGTSNVVYLNREYEELGRQIERNTRRQEQWKRAQKASNQVGQSFGKMAGNMTRFARNVALVGGAVSASIFGLANNTASLGDNVAKKAAQLGVSVEALQELRYAAERSGVATIKFDSSIERMVKRLGEAQQGTGAAKRALDDLGLSADQLATMAPDEAFSILADRLNQVEGQAQKAAFAAALFGREGVALVNMTKDGSEGLRQLRDEAQRTGYVLSDQAAKESEVFKDQLLDLSLTFTGVRNIIGTKFMPVVGDAMTQLTGWLHSNRDAVEEFATTFANGLRDVLPKVGQFLSGLTTAGVAIGQTIGKAAELVGGFQNLGLIIGGVFAIKTVLAIGAFVKSIFALGSAVVALAGGLPAVITGIKAIGLLLAANPIGLAITAIAGGAALLIANWEPVKAFFGDMFGYIGKMADFVLGSITRRIQAVGKVMSRVGSFFFGDDEEETAPLKIGNAMVSNDNEAFTNYPISQPSTNYVATQSSTGSTTTTDNKVVNFNISVTAAPGQDVETIVDEIERRVQQKRMGALYDY